MQPNPFIGVVFHWIGGLAAGSFYLPFRGVRKWSWETYWLVAGVFSWVLAPVCFALLLTRSPLSAIAGTPASVLGWGFFWGVVWGIGGLTFGLSMRYLGMSLGYAVALGLCTVFGMLMPPLFEGTFAQKLWDRSSGFTVLLGLGVCVIGIAICGLAGMSKESEMPEAQKKKAIVEFNFLKGMIVATIAGVLSASMSYGLAATKSISQASIAQGTGALWAGLPPLIVILLGGFTTNVIWCSILSTRNRSWREYGGGAVEPAHTRNDETIIETAIDAPGAEMVEAIPRTTVAVTREPRPSLAINYLLSAAAGLTWYFQFFFYTMGSSQMGKYDFSSWTLHMASIIIFSTLWGLALKEWKGTSGRTRVLVSLGLVTLIASTLVVGYGNYLGSLEK